MKPHSQAVGTLALVLATSAACGAGLRVELQDNRLRVDGKPFYMYGCWATSNGDYAEFKRRRFNTAFIGAGATPKEGPKAAAAGLMVMPYRHAPGWNDKVKAAMQAIANEDWVLAWNIGDDLHKPEDVQAALKVRGEILALDPQRRPIAFDAIGRYDEFAKIPDMWCAYAYPFVRPMFDAHAGGKPAGLPQYGEWLNAKRLQGRPDGFFWTWAQCHVQIWYNMEYLGGKQEGTASASEVWRPSRFPDGDHLRLIAAHAISAGCRGLMWFVHYYFQDDHLGRDRYARAALIGCELDVVGPLIAHGRTGERLKTSDPSVWATPIDFPGGRLICLLKTGDRYHYQPDAADAKDVRIETGVTGRVFQMGAEFKELAQPQCSFELTSWLLVTQDSALVEKLRQKYQAVQPDMAQFSVEELEARLAKVDRIFQELGQGADPGREARQRLADARKALEGKNWAEACRLAAEGLRVLRVAQHRAWRETWTDEVARAGVKVTDFYLLPRFAKEVKALKADAWGPNQLRNGSFETDEGWAGGKLGHDPTGKAAILSATSRTGKRALRLMSTAPSIYKGEQQDWVTVDVVSDKIPAKPGELWEISGWARVPKRIEQTVRGVTMALFAYSADGKAIPGYGAQGSEAVQVEATGDWKRLQLVVPLRSPNIASIAARLALCGIGEAYLDAVNVRRLQVP